MVFEDAAGYLSCIFEQYLDKTKKSKKFSKKMKKGVDKERKGMYNTSSRREQGQLSGVDDMILENDTE